MDANYLKHAIGPALNAAISSLLAHPYPTQISDPVHHVARHLLHQDATMNQIAKDREAMRAVALAVDSESVRIKALDDCKRRIGMELPEAILRIEQRGLERKAKEEAARLEKEKIEMDRLDMERKEAEEKSNSILDGTGAVEEDETQIENPEQ
ncbi:hypothetical protein BC830DRAFT_1117022 [Chytriomyces sp. MP71]|nr:hypothetical protein BC830DRAFT_1117022 [Chytriomyces sp. MP71]